VRPIELVRAGRTRPEHVTAGRLGIAWLGSMAGEAAAGKARQASQIAEIDRHIARLEALLANRAFMQKAPTDVVSRERARLEELRAQRQRLE
jgi:valyl-tRNA synthetase